MGVNGANSALTVGPPRRVPYTVGLLNVADLQAPDPAIEDRWHMGVQYLRERCDSGHGAAYLQCSTGSQIRDLDTGADTAIVAADPFYVWAGDRCSSLGWEEHDYIPRAQRLLSITEGPDVEREFWSGAQAQAGEAAFNGTYDDHQWLTAHASASVNGTTGVDSVTALSMLAEALADTVGVGRGMIHVTARSAPYLMASGAIRRDGAQWVDVMGNVIVIGSGYPGTGPADDDPGTTARWIWATGTVRYWRAADVDILPGSYAQALDRATNRIAFWAGRSYLVDWDRCATFAVKHLLKPPDVE
jgi:hypothetical protein